jgi:hypothetical protein
VDALVFGFDVVGAVTEELIVGGYKDGNVEILCCSNVDVLIAGALI